MRDTNKRRGLNSAPRAEHPWRPTVAGSQHNTQSTAASAVPLSETQDAEQNKAMGGNEIDKQTVRERQQESEKAQKGEQVSDKRENDMIGDMKIAQEMFKGK